MNALYQKFVKGFLEGYLQAFLHEHSFHLKMYPEILSENPYRNFHKGVYNFLGILYRSSFVELKLWMGIDVCAVCHGIVTETDRRWNRLQTCSMPQEILLGILPGVCTDIPFGISSWGSIMKFLQRFLLGFETKFFRNSFKDSF